MKLLVYRYNSICEPYMIEGFRKLGIETDAVSREMTDKDMLPSQRVKLVAEALERIKPDAVFSINFFPSVAEVCRIYGIPYLAYTVDCPVLELLSDQTGYDTSHIFMFDRAQASLVKSLGCKNAYHLPLAGDPSFASLPPLTGNKAPGKGVSFVGSLYNEKDPYAVIRDRLPGEVQGECDALTIAQTSLREAFFTEKVLSDGAVSSIREVSPQLFDDYGGSFKGADRFITAHCFLGFHMAAKERPELINFLSGYFETDIYTNSDTSVLQRNGNLRIHSGVKTLTEMPSVFRDSPINLNLTMLPIQTGLPQRIFDIAASGGFIMTDRRDEMETCFEPGAEAECFSSAEELLDKCSYYLSHDDERKRIAKAGFERLKKEHTWEHRASRIIMTVWGKRGSL
ncbi:MAG: glycosyltransferase [Lachnospiraceae bacterium]|nr:glycosyltransferase [Lachnospiraceae bacterium]